MSFQMYLTPPVKFKTSDHDRFIQKLEKFKKHRQEFRTPEKQITQNLIRTRSKKKVIHRKVKSLNNNKSSMFPAIVPMSAEQFRRFLNTFKNK
jgi:transposase-like protein